MELILLVESKPGLENVRAQFKQWRRSRGKRRAIPEFLWVSAASLYPEYSLHRISKGCGSFSTTYQTVCSNA
ncbi:hypothetical protein [Desulfococcus sp.]|uniref:hypothetical protein n=1 Tax=Desulfococcus sp. TaxID=2025834 RepID=UPI003594427D